MDVSTLPHTYGAQIVIPAAGLGSRFIAAGYTDPKPFIQPFLGYPTFVETALLDARLALDDPEAPAFVLLREEHVERGRELLAGRAVVISVPRLTTGAASTVELAAPFLDPDKPVFVVNSDQTFRLSLDETIEFLEVRSFADAVPLCFISEGESKWSYYDFETGNIVEKPARAPHGNMATVGAYWFRSARAMLKAIADMKANNFRVNGEFYFAPCHNYLEGKVAPVLVSYFYGLGTPEDLNKYQVVEGGRFSPGGTPMTEPTSDRPNGDM